MWAMGHQAPFSGKTTFFCGERMAAVSAMKSTPQKIMTCVSRRAAARESSRESPTKSATSCTSGIW